MGDFIKAVTTNISHTDAMAVQPVQPEREAQLADALHAVKVLEGALQYERVRVLRANHRLRQYRTGAEAIMLAPVRYVRSIVRRLTRKYRLDLVPLYQLDEQGAGQWQASGNDPQFLLLADISWPRLHGWYWLDMQIEADETLDAQLYFDLGYGFSSRHVVSFALPGHGKTSIPLYVPAGCRYIRLDPCSRAATFRVTGMTLRVLEQAPSEPGDSEQAMLCYAAMGGGSGNVASLQPGHLLSRSNVSDYAWRAEGIDPWFTVTMPPRGLRQGWYLIELRIRSEVDRGNAKLYINYGQGYSEQHTVALPFRSGASLLRLAYFSSVPRAMRFDPVECVTAFSVERLHIEPVAADKAQALMMTRVAESYEGEGGEASVAERVRDQARQSGTDSSTQLRRLYDATYRHDPSSVDYAEWIQRNEKSLFNDVEKLRQQREAFERKPQISIVMPVYGPELDLLAKAIDSVLAQSYDNWQLCIADDASPDARVRALLQNYAERDSRIAVVFREVNGHISAASNSALELATGDYVALLDHDDELSAHALHFVVEAINRQPTAKVIYTDEDKIDEQGARSEPHFKSSWNPDLFFSQNYVSHLGVYDRALLRQIGGFRVGVEGSQDQDLLLRCLPLIDAADIVHVPMVLYHWRVTQGSTAKDSGGKTYTTTAGIQALQDHFTSQGLDVTVEEGLVPNTYRIRYPIPDPAPLVSLLVPTRDKVDLLRDCIESIRTKSTYQNFEILVLDNESVEPATIAYFDEIRRADPRVRVLSYPHPFNYSAINNFGAREARGEVLGLVNNDIEVISPEWLTEMVGHVMRSEIGCVGAKLYFGDDTLQHAGVILGLGGVAGHSHKYFPRESAGYFHRLQVVQNLSAVTAACLLVRKSVYMQVGGLEEQALRVAFNDVDFCLKVRQAGYRNLWTPYAELYHHESKSRGSEDTPEKQARFSAELAYMQQKWAVQLRTDPYYSQNLTTAREDFSIA